MHDVMRQIRLRSLETSHLTMRYTVKLTDPTVGPVRTNAALLSEGLDMPPQQQVPRVSQSLE